MHCYTHFSNETCQLKTKWQYSDRFLITNICIFIARLPCFMGAMKWGETNARWVVQWSQLCDAWSWGQAVASPGFPRSLSGSSFSWVPSGVCAPGVSVNSLFSLVTGLDIKYLPGDSCLQIPVFFWLAVDTVGAHNQLLLVLFGTLLNKFEPSWFSTGCLRSLAFYFPWAHKNHSRFFFCLAFFFFF